MCREMGANWSRSLPYRPVGWKVRFYGNSPRWLLFASWEPCSKTCGIYEDYHWIRSLHWRVTAAGYDAVFPWRYLRVSLTHKLHRSVCSNCHLLYVFLPAEYIKGVPYQVILSVLYSLRFSPPKLCSWFRWVESP